MPLNEKQIAAYSQLEDAVNNIAEAFEFIQAGELLTAWVLSVHGIKLDTGEDCDEVWHDDESVHSVYSYFVRRGQPHAMSVGVLTSNLDKMLSR